MTDEQKLNEFLESITCPAIVEGQKDANALKRHKIEDTIILNKGQSLLETVEAISGMEVTILTDMDQHGKILRKKLLKLFPLYGVKENRKPRELFARLRLSHIEGLQPPK